MWNNWETLAIIGSILYVIFIAIVIVRILFDTRNDIKAMAYIMLVFFIPLFGALFYIVFGVNFWKKKRYAKKLMEDDMILDDLQTNIQQYNDSMLQRIEASDDERGELAAMLIRDLQSPLTTNNKVKLLQNGEEKFPELLEAIENAKHHIHIEYYIFDNDEIGKQILDILVRKAKEGVKVRFIFDDFGSPTIKKKDLKMLQEAGVEAHPFYKVHFYILANRMNYRNHRKIVVVDGITGFVGGINVSDKYINNGKNKLYWRDTHLRIDGPGVYYLQYLFLSDWNFCAECKLKAEMDLFPTPKSVENGTYMQIAASGPDSPQPTILFSILQMIFMAREEILITTPYFIPSESILHALRVAALSGLKVILLAPGISDSKMVNAASKSYYDSLLDAGVQVYQYQRGFVHAKTMVCDSATAMVGTANMDNRSFDFNFEVCAIIYNRKLAEEMRQTFYEDLKDAEKIDETRWRNRPFLIKLSEKIARLLSPVL